MCDKKILKLGIAERVRRTAVGRMEGG